MDNWDGSKGLLSDSGPADDGQQKSGLVTPSLFDRSSSCGSRIASTVGERCRDPQYKR